LIDWDAFRPLLSDLYTNDEGKGGRPNYDVALVFSRAESLAYSSRIAKLKNVLIEKGSIRQYIVLSVEGHKGLRGSKRGFSKSSNECPA